jgi:hypothetical protein
MSPTPEIFTGRIMKTQASVTWAPRHDVKGLRERANDEDSKCQRRDVASAGRQRLIGDGEQFLALRVDDGPDA